MKKIVLVVVLALFPLALSAADPDTTRALHEIFRAEWERTMEQNPTWASMLGDRRYNDRWADVSVASAEAQQRHRLQALERLARIDPATLSPGDQLNRQLFELQLRNEIEEHPYRLWLIQMHHRGGVQTADDLASSLRFQTIRDYEEWLTRMRGIPQLVDQTIEVMRQGAEEKILWPRITLQRIPAQIERQIVDDPTVSGFYAPFRRMPESFSQEDRDRLAAEAREAIEEKIVPAYQRLLHSFLTEYLPAAPVEVGLGRLPRGREAYAARARRFTTTAMTPEQIHERGLQEVERIRTEMLSVMRSTGFEGTLEEFFVRLRMDPQFYYSDPEALLEGYRAISKRIDPEMVRLFGKLPRMPYGVTPIPAAIAPDTTTAYYRQPAADGSRAGQYFVNLYRPETRPKYEMMALSLHEAVPGHHLQIALAQELGEIPEFRRYGGYTAFIEGWGLYAESLGDELGLYDDPYSKFGQLTYEMWRAVRLVVDTGMHVLGWSRQRAIDYFIANAAKSEHDVVNEIDRYIANPGQALAYKIGELKIKELRARGSAQLGEQFDVRAFHDVVLGAGAVPLDVLEQRIDDWIASQKEAP
jgi:uncharacterized protein (DUF885 family)